MNKAEVGGRISPVAGVFLSGLPHKLLPFPLHLQIVEMLRKLDTVDLVVDKSSRDFELNPEAIAEVGDGSSGATRRGETDDGHVHFGIFVGPYLCFSV